MPEAGVSCRLTAGFTGGTEMQGSSRDKVPHPADGDPWQAGEPAAAEG